MAASPEELQALFDVNPRPMWVFDSETLAFLAVNDATCALYGWTRDEMLGMSLRDIRDPAEVPLLEHALVEFHARGRVKAVQITKHKLRDGRTLDVQLDLREVRFGARPAVLTVVTDLTDAAHAAHLFRLLVEHSADGIALVDEHEMVRYVNPAGERILGAGPGALTGKHVNTWRHPDEPSGVRVPAAGATLVNVSRMRRGDGAWRWIELTVTNRILDPAIRAYVSTFRDITERRATEIEMRETRARLEYLLSATKAITYTAPVPHGHGATFVSANVKDILGYDPAVARGAGFWFERVHPDDRARVEHSLLTLYATGQHSLEYRFRHADGSYRWMQDDKRIVRESDAAPAELVGFWLDVTERHRVEDSLRASEANFRALIERAPMVTLVQRGGRFVYVNPAAVEMLGYSSIDEIVGRPVLDFIHADDRELIRVRMANTVARGTSPIAEFAMLRRDGTTIVLEAEAILLPFDGELSNVVIGRDVNERREMFARFAVAERMMSVGTLAAGVAHEINNPLAYVVGNLALLASELPHLVAGRGGGRLAAGDLADVLADAQEGAARVSTIVRDLRALSRTDEETRGPVDVVAVLASSVKMAHNELRHRARVVRTFEDGLPPVHANAARLGQVFLNLLINAAQAIPDGPIGTHEIRLRARAGADRTTVTIEVEDTGAGIPSNVIGRIFDPFFTTKPIGVGTGLGLAICHQIVRSMGGEITVASTPGQGTTVRVTLPVAEVATVAGVAASAAAASTAPSRVLLIDDEAAVGRSSRYLLAPEHDVVPVTRAADGLARIAAGEQFDVILCDLMMPGTSGIEFQTQLAALAPQYLDRLVFMTGGAFTEHARRFLATQPRPPLEKPFSEDELRRAVESVRDARPR